MKTRLELRPFVCPEERLATLSFLLTFCLASFFTGARTRPLPDLPAPRQRGERERETREGRAAANKKRLSDFTAQEVLCMFVFKQREVCSWAGGGVALAW